MSDKGTPEEQFAAEMAKLTPEQQAEVRAQAEFQMALSTPVVLPIAWDVQPVQVEGEPAIVLAIQTPANLTRVVILRDGALNLASQIRKVAQTGPRLVTPPSGLIVPGR